MNQTHAKLEAATRLLHNANRIVALTGAGISTPSGIPDFRSDSGLWDEVDPMLVASIQAFRQWPEKFYNWLRPLARTMLLAQPNPAHHALAQMEKNGRLQAVVTQNIDMLHSKAGSETVFELHGHLREATCPTCGHATLAEPLIEHYLTHGNIPRCERCDTIIKPDVILFGELLPRHIMLRAQAAVQTCDLLLVAGSSLEVAPAGDLPRLAKANGAHIIMVNYGQTYFDPLADVLIQDDVATILPALAQMLEGNS